MLYGGSFNSSTPQNDEEQLGWLVERDRPEEAEYALLNMEDVGREVIVEDEKSGWLRIMKYGCDKAESLKRMDSHSRFGRTDESRCWDLSMSISGLHHAGDSATAIAVHSRFLVVGTQKGMVLVTDHTGNTLHSFDNVHSASVTDASFNETGEVIATSSRDGTVAICFVYCDTQSQQHNIGSPLRCVTLDPASTPKQWKLVSGGKSGELHLLTSPSGVQRLFKKSKSKICMKVNQQPSFEGGGVIHTAKWRDTLVAVGSDIGFHIYDSEAETEVAVPSLDLPPKEADFRCSICWEFNDSLLLAWGPLVVVLCILELPTIDQEACKRQKRSSKYAQIVHRSIIPGESIICGIAPFARKLVVLTVPQVGRDGDRTPPTKCRPQPELIVLRRELREIKQEMVYRMVLTGVENLFAMHYRLCVEDGDQDDRAYFVMTPLEVVAISPRDAEGHIQFLAITKRRPEAAHCLSVLETSARDAILTAEKDLRLLEVNRCCRSLPKVTLDS